MSAPCTRCGVDCSGNCLKLAEGTQPGRPQPMPGDIVEIAHHRKGVFGVRLGRVSDSLFTRGDPVFVYVPGYETPWAVWVEHLTIIHRPKSKEQP